MPIRCGLRWVLNINDLMRRKGWFQADVLNVLVGGFNDGHVELCMLPAKDPAESNLS